MTVTLLLTLPCVLAAALLLTANAAGPTQCKTSKLGKEYVGTVSQTRRGIPCQAWTSQFPHSHAPPRDSNFPDVSAAAANNYCRNPNNSPEGPWCYTTDPAVLNAYCDVPFCPSDECATSPCRNRARCENTVGGHQCHCLPWHTGVDCATSKTFTLMTQSRQYLTVSGNNAVTLTGNVYLAQRFIIAAPCKALPSETGCLSLMAADRPGWYPRHYGYNLWLESEVSPRNPHIYNQDASFYLRKDTPFAGCSSLESVNYPGHYVIKDNNAARGLYISRLNNPAIVSEQSCFNFVEQ